jgi:hypothetical protein
MRGSNPMATTWTQLKRALNGSDVVWEDFNRGKEGGLVEIHRYI